MSDRLAARLVGLSMPVCGVLMLMADGLSDLAPLAAWVTWPPTSSTLVALLVVGWMALLRFTLGAMFGGAAVALALLGANALWNATKQVLP